MLAPIRKFLSDKSFVLSLVTVLLMPSSVFAGNFSVSPVRVFMKPMERATAMTIVNHGDTELVLETELTSWKQKPDGSFDQQPTDDVIVAPPQMRLAPKGRQVIRIARVTPALPSVQMTYRLLVREVPLAKAAQSGYTVNLALAFSIPIFITPPGFKYDVNCKLMMPAPVPAVSSPAIPGVPPPPPPPWMIARCDNAGTAHAFITSVKLLDSAGIVLASSSQAGYTLASAGRNFELFKPAGAQAFGTGSLRLAISHDDGTQQSVNVTLPQ